MDQPLLASAKPFDDVPGREPLMDPASWEQAKDVLADALKQPPADREAFVTERCADPALRAEILALLQQYEGASAFLEQPIHPDEPDELDDLQPGTRIGPYVIVDRLGRGGMGQVFLGSDTRLRRKVALKCLVSTRWDGERPPTILNEARAAARINHPNVATVHDVIEHNSRAFIVMEYVEGESLAARLRHERLPVDRTIEIGRQLASALAAAHATGVIHRDLKPANVQVLPDGSVKILDFGVATAVSSAPSSSARTTGAARQDTRGVRHGTPGYMAPEQAAGGDVDARSDIFSLGVVLYEMVTGRRPFERTDPSDAAGVPQNPPRADAGNPAVPRELADAIARALEVDPAKRFAAAADLEAALAKIEAVHLPAPGGSHRAARLRVLGRRRLALMAVLSAVVIGGVVLIFAGITSAWRQHLGRPPSPVIRAIAVLPFEDLNGPDQEYLSDGMTDLLIDDLSRITALRVISRTSVMQYKHTRQSLPQIARALGVEGVVEGSVVRSGSQLQIIAKLIDAATDRPLWSNTYRRASGDFLSLQNEIAIDIAGKIKVRMTQQELQRFQTPERVDPRAQEAYFRGRAHYAGLTGEGIQQAIENFQSAVRIDPGYARAYAALSHAYWILGTHDFGPHEESYAKAEQAALEALRLDPNTSLGYSALGQMRFYHDWNWREAESAFMRAVELNPSDPDAHELLGWYWASRGRLDEAEAAMASARMLNPAWPGHRSAHAAVLYYARRYDEALQELREMLASHPDLEATHFRLARVYSGKGMFAEALAELDRPAPSRAVRLAETARILAAAGQRDRAVQTLHDLEFVRAHGAERVNPESLAFVYAALGDRNRTFGLLAQAISDRSPNVLWLKVDPRFDPVRDDERFARVLEQLGF
jgi:TolB-like protein/Tfp pilus assembly protein PilF/predicted Ser/Thr protein kinase